MAKAAEHENIVAIKDTSLDLERTHALLAATKHTNILVLQGNESLVLESLSLGAAGMVTALANIVPEWHASLLKSVSAENPKDGADSRTNHQSLADVSV